MSLYAAVVFSSPTTPPLTPTTPVTRGSSGLPIADAGFPSSHAACRIDREPLHATLLACLAVPVDPKAPHQIRTAYILPTEPDVPELDGPAFTEVDDLLALANILPALLLSNPRVVLPRLVTDVELRQIAADALFAGACLDPHGKRLANLHESIIRSLVDHQVEAFSLAAITGGVH